jgi:hypothetical protein
MHSPLFCSSVVFRICIPLLKFKQGKEKTRKERMETARSLLSRYRIGIGHLLNDVTILKDSGDVVVSFVAFVAVPFLLIVVLRWVWQKASTRPLTAHEIETRQSWSDRFEAIDSEIQAVVQEVKDVSPVAPPATAAVASVTPAKSAKKIVSRHAGSVKSKKDAVAVSTPTPTPLPSSASTSGKKDRRGSRRSEAVAQQEQAAPPPQHAAPAITPAKRGSGRKSNENKTVARSQSPEVESKRPSGARSSIAPKVFQNKQNKNRF